MKETVAILGASDSPERYAHKAKQALLSKGYQPILVNPQHSEIDGIVCFSALSESPHPIDTITVYTNPRILSGLVSQIIAAQPRRVILNPGTEDDAVVEQLQRAGITVQIACTLVLLSTEQFDDSR